ncbi:unnamed protein product [Fraxinus pennsylvanica]|uniref:Methyltransferase n=1 Tax=Fraxinus pennsylvanica TaxID=56036 RepID=A0AAD1ZSU3_9LAMI|nr:unnamed protein product [Fraxinus pennsylvanica]
MPVCMASYESTGSQVQVALERGLPAIIGNFISKQLLFPSLSYDMVHCAHCGIIWDDKDGYFLLRLTEYSSQESRPSGSLSSVELEVHGVDPEDFFEDLEFRQSALRSYWPLLSPLIFSDHPKRPDIEDPLPPYDMIHNMMDMNAQFEYRPFSSEFLSMSVLLSTDINSIRISWNADPVVRTIERRCKPFPTYPRTYDMLHAKGLLSHLASKGCSVINLLFKMDRILRPEGWIIISDKIGPIEKERSLAIQLHWEPRVIDLQSGSDHRILVCRSHS